MPLQIDSITVLQDYLKGVLDRAGHHAGNLDGVALTLLGAMIWRRTNDIHVREYNGRPANVIWLSVNENHFAMVYNHHTGMIELRERNQNGAVIKAFDNATPYHDIISVFSNL